jgi:hypothetical protein
MKKIVLMPLILFSFCHAFGCDCVHTIGWSELYAISESDAVFRGRVVSVNEIGHGGSIDGYYRVTFAVDSVVKGAVPATMSIVLTGIQPEDCGIVMVAKERYIVYASNKELDAHLGRQLLTDACKGTHKVHEISFPVFLNFKFLILNLRIDYI